ncbi:MAG: S-layer homology domain-containing protein, partial [Bacillota bacterium]
MKSRQFKKALSSCLAVIMLISVFITSPGIAVESNAEPAASISEQKIYTSATAWAKPEIEKAYQHGLIPSRLLSLDAPKPATREELCEISVLLYEAVTGKKADPANPNPFTDTTNTEILKAYKLGITSGTSTDAFSPDSITNREQVAAIFGRAISVMFPNDDYSTVGAPVFSDQKLISSWALEHVKYMSKNGILTGAGGKFMPKAVTDAQKASGYGTTKREEAIAIAVRIYEKYKLGGVLGNKEKAAISLIRTAKPALSEKENFTKIDFNNRLFRPVYKPKITLMAADGYSSSGTPTYSSAPFAAFIRSDGNKTEAFKISLPADVLSQTSQIVWQVLVAPPAGSPVNGISPKPGGLLLSGTLSKQTKE